MWLHVDGAYGAPGVLDSRYRAELDPLARADSVALDAHKWLYVPYDAGAVFVRDEELMRDAFSFVPPYLRETADPDGVTWLPWLSEYGLEQTRAFRALKLWMALAYHGRAGYAAVIGRDVDNAARFAELVRAQPGLELVAHNLSIVCLRCVGAGMSGRRAGRLQPASAARRPARRRRLPLGHHARRALPAAGVLRQSAHARGGPPDRDRRDRSGGRRGAQSTSDLIAASAFSAFSRPS